MTDRSITGGCQCGAVRYRAGGLGPANICHCRMCQRAMGNAFAPLVVGRDVAFDGAPARFRSSDVAERGFCRDCGTPLFYAPTGTDMIVLTIGSLDNPNMATPTLHYGIEGLVDWLKLDDDLPRKPTRPGGLSGKGPDVIRSMQAPVDRDV